MKLDAARLCLDCEEVHEDQVCPVCSSEAFAYLTRWVQPATEARITRPPQARRMAEPAPSHTTRTPEQIEAYRQLIEGKPPARGGLLAKGVLGLAAFSLAGWAWRASRARTDADARADAQKLKIENGK
jgi:hypothetical protein